MATLGQMGDHDQTLAKHSKQKVLSEWAEGIQVFLVCVSHKTWPSSLVKFFSISVLIHVSNHWA